MVEWMKAGGDEREGVRAAGVSVTDKGAGDLERADGGETSGVPAASAVEE